MMKGTLIETPFKTWRTLKLLQFRKERECSKFQQLLPQTFNSSKVRLIHGSNMRNMLVMLKILSLVKKNHQELLLEVRNVSYKRAKDHTTDEEVNELSLLKSCTVMGF